MFQLATTEQIITRFKKQFLFLFSFLFKTPAILSQQAVSNINVSQQSFSSFSFFLSFFFLLLEKMPKSPAEACNKCSFTNLMLMKQNPFSFSLLFWIHIIPIFRKSRRKNSLSCTYLCLGLIFRFLSFTGEWHPWSWRNWRLSFANVCPELNFIFQIFSDEKVSFWR